ncbi:hypothetical protein J6590_073374 [Homalodisca vitripennis]|nr:hypothetical protein J6590_073374 [Homalodisca vitripennis]
MASATQGSSLSHIVRNPLNGTNTNQLIKSPSQRCLFGLNHPNQCDATYCSALQAYHTPIVFVLAVLCCFHSEQQCSAVGLTSGSKITMNLLYCGVKSIELFREVSAKKSSLTLNLGINGLKVTSEPPPMAGQVGCLQGQDRSAATHPSGSHARRCLIWLSCDNRRTRYTAPLAKW